MLLEKALRVVWLQALVLSHVVLLCSSAGTPTRFTTDQLPQYKSSVSVTDSRAGNFMASVGNGYLGTVVYSDTLHIAGLFSGKAYSKKYPIYPIYLYQHAHRARIPSPAAIIFDADTPGHESYTLDVAEGIFYKWFTSPELSVEQRVYAHRARKNILVVEIAANNSASKEHLLNISVNSGKYSKDIGFLEYPVPGTTEALAAIGEVWLLVS